MFLKGIVLRNALKKSSSKLIYPQSYGHTLFDTFGTLFLLCTSDQQEKHTLCRGAPNEQSTKFVSD